MSSPIKIFLSWSLISCQGKISKSSENLTKVAVAKIIVQIPCSPSPLSPLSPLTPSLSSQHPQCSALSHSLSSSVVAPLHLFIFSKCLESGIWLHPPTPPPTPGSELWPFVIPNGSTPQSRRQTEKNRPGSFPSKSWLIRISGSNSSDRSKATPDLNFVVRYQTWFGTTPCQAGSTGKAHFIGQCHIAALSVKGARVRNNVCFTTNATVVVVIDN